MRRTFIIPIFAVIAIAILTVPMVMAWFTGMHTFPQDYGADCERCHPGVRAELLAGKYHKMMACTACHTGGHAAGIVECVKCHGEVPTELEDTKAAHHDIYMAALDSTIMHGGDEACIACHTMVGFNVTAPPTETLVWDATTGNWTKV